MWLPIVICLCGLISAQSYEIAEDFAPCTTNEGKSGVCIPIRKCPSALQTFQYRRHPETCWFDRTGPVICCQKSDNIMTPPRGWKSKEQCGKYYKIRVVSRFWFWGAAHGLIGGFRTSAKEFPHMAVLGFGEESDIKWACGGSLISEKYVMTAAHCLNSRTLGEVKYVRLGDLNLNATDDDAQPQEFKIIRRIHHPDFKPPSQYNDIALVELDRPAEINEYVKPACLQTEDEIEDPVWIATGWGSSDMGQETVDHLQKVHINEYNFQDCKRMYGSSGRRLRNGLMADSHICAGDDTKDTCQGDSGGPLQIKNVEYTSGYTIIGITSFGSGTCGVLNAPGVYTRVSKYIDWIESIVWPN